jgi:hypothetical protein
LLAGFTHRPAAYHAAVATPPGWYAFKALCRGDLTWAGLAGHPAARTILAAIGRQGAISGQRAIGAHPASNRQAVIGGQP